MSDDKLLAQWCGVNGTTVSVYDPGESDERPTAKVGDRVQSMRFAGPPNKDGSRIVTGKVLMLQAVILLDHEFMRAGELPVVSVGLSDLTILSSADSGEPR